MITKQLQPKTRVVVEKSVVDQVLEAPVGTVIIVESSGNLFDGGVLTEVLVRTGAVGWTYTHRNRPRCFGMAEHKMYLDKSAARTFIETAEKAQATITTVTGGKA